MCKVSGKESAWNWTSEVEFAGYQLGLLTTFEFGHPIGGNDWCKYVLHNRFYPRGGMFNHPSTFVNVCEGMATFRVVAHLLPKKQLAMCKESGNVLSKPLNIWLRHGWPLLYLGISRTIGSANILRVWT